MLDLLEKKSTKVDALIKRLNVQEERSVVNSKIAQRYRDSLIKFEQIKKEKKKN